MRHGSLFNGIGGFDLAAEWMGWENVFHCEHNEFGKKILKYYWPSAISYDDIKKTDFNIHRGTIDVLTGGFPCQGFSLAGLRRGTDDDRYLWPEYLRAIDETNPAWVVGENVTGILTMEDKSGVYRDVFAKVESSKITRLCDVDYYEVIYTRQAKMLVASICESLEERGYEVQTFAIPAASVEAPHQRERIWFVANYKGERFGEAWPSVSGSEKRATGDGGKRNVTDATSGSAGSPGKSEKITTKRGENNNKQKSRGIEAKLNYGCNTILRDRSVTNATIKGLEVRQEQRANDEQKHGAVKRDSNTWDRWPTQSPVCSGDDGISTRLDGIAFSKWRNESIKSAGNAIVPQVVWEIFKAIEQYKNLGKIDGQNSQ